MFELRKQEKNQDPTIIKRSRNYKELKLLKLELERKEKIKEKASIIYWITPAIPSK